MRLVHDASLTIDQQVRGCLRDHGPTRDFVDAPACLAQDD